MASLEELNNLVQTQQEKINQLERKVIEYQADIIQLEQTHSRKIENLETALQEEKTKVNRLLEIEEKKRRLTEDLGNGITLELVEIPAGKFLMGGREITLKSFLIGKYPVTQGQWEAVMGNNPSHFKGNNNLPVEMVSWSEANLFCQKLSQLSGRNYQLPSESQWEYACRAGKNTAYFFGDNERDLDRYAWHHDNSNQKTHPVGEKLPNPWGLYDIVGNVWQWCQDDWQEGYNYIPVNGSSAWIRNSTKKSLRGGAWTHNFNRCRSDRNDDCSGSNASGYLNHVGLGV